VDPYQTLNRFYDCFEVLNSYNERADMPRIKGFMDDFSPFQTETISYFENDNNVYTIPFDSTTMILFYRTDIFEKYADEFYQDMGYDWSPGTKDFTWERYIEAAKWIDENVGGDEVKHGSGAMAQEHNSIFCEFSNILAAYGGDYFSDRNINTLGRKSFSSIDVMSDRFIKALDVYKQMVDTAAPESVNWNWTDSADAFRNGEIAMMLNWDENYPYLDDPDYSKVSGNVGCAILPYGDTRSANIFGGSGIGINKFATEEEKEAAWLYIVWATSQEMQREVLINPEGGNLPSRLSVYEEPDIKRELEDKNVTEHMLNIDLIETVLEAWQTENLYLRPKVSNFYSIEQVLNKNLHDFVSQDIDSHIISQNIYQELTDIKAKSDSGEQP
jgi:multiple sugar transport system substrate-binding protein